MVSLITSSLSLITLGLASTAKLEYGELLQALNNFWRAFPLEGWKGRSGGGSATNSHKLARTILYYLVVFAGVELITAELTRLGVSHESDLGMRLPIVTLDEFILYTRNIHTQLTCIQF